MAPGGRLRRRERPPEVGDRSGFPGLGVYPSEHPSDPCHGNTSPENLGIRHGTGTGVALGENRGLGRVLLDKFYRDIGKSDEKFFPRYAGSIECPVSSIAGDRWRKRRVSTYLHSAVCGQSFGDLSSAPHTG